MSRLPQRDLITPLGYRIELFGSNRRVKVERGQLWCDRNPFWTQLRFLTTEKFRSRSRECIYCYACFGGWVLLPHECLVCLLLFKASRKLANFANYNKRNIGNCSTLLVWLHTCVNETITIRDKLYGYPKCSTTVQAIEFRFRYKNILCLYHIKRWVFMRCSEVFERDNTISSEVVFSRRYWLDGAWRLLHVITAVVTKLFKLM